MRCTEDELSDIDTLTTVLGSVPRFRQVHESVASTYGIQNSAHHAHYIFMAFTMTDRKATFEGIQGELHKQGLSSVV